MAVLKSKLVEPAPTWKPEISCR